MSDRVQAELAHQLTQPARLTLNEQVYQEMRRLIIGGRLRPGQQVSIRALASLVNVSPVPVRSALQRLVTETALEARPNRTFIVPTLTPEDFLEITDIRRRLEGVATERAVARLTKKDVALLREFNQEMFGTQRCDWQRYLDLNRQFHFHIYTAAAMPRVLRFIEILWLQIGPLLNLVASSDSVRSGKDAHTAAVQAIAKGDVESARAAIERDIQDAAGPILKELTRNDAGSG